MNKTIYVRDLALWEQATQQARHERSSISAIIERALRAYLHPRTTYVPE